MLSVKIVGPLWVYEIRDFFNIRPSTTVGGLGSESPRVRGRVANSSAWWTRMSGQTGACREVCNASTSSCWKGVKGAVQGMTQGNRLLHNELLPRSQMLGGGRTSDWEGSGVEERRDPPGTSSVLNSISPQRLLRATVLFCFCFPISCKFLFYPTLTQKYMY